MPIISEYMRTKSPTVYLFGFLVKNGSTLEPSIIHTLRATRLASNMPYPFSRGRSNRSHSGSPVNDCYSSYGCLAINRSVVGGLGFYFASPTACLQSAALLLFRPISNTEYYTSRVICSVFNHVGRGSCVRARTNSYLVPDTYLRDERYVFALSHVKQNTTTST